MKGDLPSLVAALATLPRDQREAIRLPSEIVRRALAARPPAPSLQPASTACDTPSVREGTQQKIAPPPPPDPNSSLPPAPPHIPPKPTAARPARLAELRQRVLRCTLCPHLVATRKNVVFGVGNPEADLMFVGEAPGADEDLQGEPFVGAAGKLLTKIIEAMGLSREKVFIANVLKCRPDMPPGAKGNRPPRKEEMATCLPHLIEQIRIVSPRCIVALGSTAVCGLFGLPEVKMGAVRGKWKLLELDPPRAIPVMVTYHPAYLLRNQSLSEKRKIWLDMLAVLEHLSYPISARQRAFFLPPAR